MFPKGLQCILSFFDFCGYDTGASYLSGRRKMLYFINFIHILMAILCTIRKVILTIELNHLIRVIEVVNTSIQYSGALCTYWIIVLESMIHRQNHRLFWDCIQCNVCFYAVPFQRFLLKFISYLSITVILYSSFFVSNNFQNLVDNFVYLILCSLCQIRSFYYIFCLEMMLYQLSAIESELKAMTTLLHLENELHRFNRVREIYQKVFKMSVHLNDIFGCSQVSLILFCFFKLLTELNWFYAHFHEQTLNQKFGK